MTSKDAGERNAILLPVPAKDQDALPNLTSTWSWTMPRLKACRSSLKPRRAISIHSNHRTRGRSSAGSCQTYAHHRRPPRARGLPDLQSRRRPERTRGLENTEAHLKSNCIEMKSRALAIFDLDSTRTGGHQHKVIAPAVLCSTISPLLGTRSFATSLRFARTQPGHGTEQNIRLRAMGKACHDEGLPISTNTASSV
jgi:hypothetical protein